MSTSSQGRSTRVDRTIGLACYGYFYSCAVFWINWLRYSPLTLEHEDTSFGMCGLSPHTELLLRVESQAPVRQSPSSSQIPAPSFAAGFRSRHKMFLPMIPSSDASQFRRSISHERTPQQLFVSCYLAMSDFPLCDSFDMTDNETF